MTCDCIKCRRDKKVKCDYGFPRMVVLGENRLFNVMYFSKDLNEYLFLIDELVYALIRLE